MEQLALASALGSVIGLVLAFTGAGGGILAIPLLVFGLHLPVQQAAPIGLLAVGLASVLGAGMGLREGVVRYRAAGLIGGFGVLLAPAGVALAQRLPNQPLLVAFAFVLGFVAARMLRPPSKIDLSAKDAPCLVNPQSGRISWTWPCARALAATGGVSGLLSGLLGVGGGFVIVPALERHTDLSVRSIHATSLGVIALVSASGVSAALLHGSFDWSVALPFAGGAACALLLGRRIARGWDPARLRQGFAWISLLVAILLLVRALG